MFAVPPPRFSFSLPPPLTNPGLWPTHTPGVWTAFALVFIEIINNFKDSKEGSVFSSLPRQSFKSTVTH